MEEPRTAGSIALGLINGGFCPAISPIKRINYRETKGLTAEWLVDMIKRDAESRGERFIIDAGNSFAVKNIARWMMGDPDFRCIDPDTLKPTKGDLSKGIYLSGETGVGKSFLMSVFNTFAHNYTMSFETVGTRSRSRSYISWYQYRSDRIVSYYSSCGDIQPLCDEDMRCLCIDDLGSEASEAMYMGSRINVIRQIIEARGDNRGLITHFTSNIPLCDTDRLRGMYGDRVMSRLRGMCNYIEVQGADKR